MSVVQEPTLLIVDDNASFLQVLKIQLEREQYNVLIYSNGEEALAAIQTNPSIDLAIVDVNMPELDGILFTKKVRELPHNPDLPILLLTGMASPQDVERGLSSGANDYMTKPFHPIELKARVRNLLRLHQFSVQIQRQYRVMQHDLEIARELQLSLIPNSPMNTPHIRFAWLYQPSSYVGGDMVNVFAFSEEHYGFYVADVSGHGVASAMLSTWLYHTLKPTVEQVSPLPPTTSQFSGLPLASPRSVAILLDQMMSAKQSEHYLTLCYAIYHVPSRCLTFIRCGHPYPLLISASGQCEVITQSSSPAIGMSLGLPFEADTKKLQPGDRLYFYSDALTEALSPTGETFGLERLCIELLASSHLKLQEQVQHMLRTAQQFQNKQEFMDDVTLLAVEIPTT